MKNILFSALIIVQIIFYFESCTKIRADIFEGTGFDDKSYNPLSNASVELWWWHSDIANGQAKTTTDNNGKFKLAHKLDKAGYYGIRVIMSGYYNNGFDFYAKEGKSYKNLEIGLTKK